MDTIEVTVPDGLQPGDTFEVKTEWGGCFTIACPEGSAGGDSVAVDLPSFESVSEEIDAIAAVRKFIEDDDSHYMAKVQEFCLANADQFAHSEEDREYPLE